MKRTILFLLSLCACIPYIQAVEYYWTGRGANSNWNSPQNWSLSSGGTDAVTFLPKNTDNVIFDANSFSIKSTVTINTDASCNNITFKDIPSNKKPQMSVDNALHINGSGILWPGMTVNGNGTIYLENTAGETKTFTPNEVIINCKVNITGNAAWTINGNLKLSTTSSSYIFTCDNSNKVAITGGLRAYNIIISGKGDVSVGDSIYTVNTFTFSGSGNLTVDKSLYITTPYYNKPGIISGTGSMLIKENIKSQYFTFSNGTTKVEGSLQYLTGIVGFFFINKGCEVTVGQVEGINPVTVSDNGTKFTVTNTYSASDINISSGAKASIKGNINCSGSIYVSDANSELTVNGQSIGCSNFSVTGNGTVTGLANSTVQCNIWNYSSTATPVLTPGIAPALIRINTGNFTGISSQEYNNVEFYGNAPHSISYANCNQLTVSGGSAAFGNAFTVKKLIISSPSRHTLAAIIQVTDRLQIKPLAGCGLISVSGGTFAVGGSTVDVASLVLENQQITGNSKPYFVTNGIDNGRNNGWSFPPAPASRTCYWVGGTGNWSDPNHWATASKGTGGANCVPTPFDNVVFDENSGLNGAETVTLDVAAFCDSMTWRNISGKPSLVGSVATPLTISGSLKLCTGLILGGATADTRPYIYFDSKHPEVESIFTAGVNMRGNYYFQSKNGTGKWKFLDDFIGDNNNTLSNITFTAGELDFNGKNLTTGDFLSTSTSIAGTSRKLTIANSTVQVVGWSYKNDNRIAMTADLTANSLIKVSASFICENNPQEVYHNLEANRSTSTTTYSIYYAAFNKITIGSSGYVLYAFPSTPIQTDTLLLMAPGGSAYLLYNNILIHKLLENRQDCDVSTMSYLKSNNTDSRTIMMDAGAKVNLKMMEITGVNITGGNPDFAIVNSKVTDGSTGWRVTAPSGRNLYWIGGTGNWNDPQHWSLKSGGAGGACAPTQYDNVIFDNLSFSAEGQRVTVTAVAVCDSMTWRGTTLSACKPNFRLEANISIYGSLQLAPGMTTSQSEMRYLYLRSTRTNESLKTSGVQITCNFFYFEGTSAQWEIPDGLRIKSDNNVTVYLYFNGTSAAKYIFRGAVSDVYNVYFEKGYLDLSGQTLSAASFIPYTGSGDVSRRLNIRDANISLSLDWNYNGILTAEDSKGSVININSSIPNRTVTTAAGQVYNDINFVNTYTLNSNGASFRNVKFSNDGTVNDGTYSRLTFLKSGTLNSLSADTLEFSNLTGGKYTFNAGATTTVNKAWYASGNPCSVHTICSSVPGTRANISIPKAIANIALDPSNRDTLYIDFVNIRDIHNLTSAEAGSERAIVHKGKYSQNTGGFGADGNNSGDWIWDKQVDVTNFEGFSTKNLILGCKAYPYRLNSMYFMPGPNSTFEWRKGSASDAIVGTESTYSLLSNADLGHYFLTVRYNTTGCFQTDDITLAPLPTDSMFWTGAVSSDWNNTANWKLANNHQPAIPPDACTPVVIPETATLYPDLTPGTTTYEKEENGEKIPLSAACLSIHFRHGAEVARTDSLHYGEAFVDLCVNTHEWYMVSPPLKQFYTGDFYFTDPNPYKDSHLIETMYYQGANPQTGGVHSVYPALSGLFNSADIKLEAGNGLFIWANKVDKPVSYHTPFTFHFPKQDSVYYYYREGYPIDQAAGRSGRLNRDSCHRFIYEPLPVDGFVPLKTKSNIANAARKIQTGNPFMAHLDFKKFANDNSGNINAKNPSYQIICGLPPSGQSGNGGLLGYTATYYWDGNAWLTTYAGNDPNPHPGFIAPMQSFIVEVANRATPIAVHVSSVVTDPGNRLRSASRGTGRRKLEILAIRGLERNKTLLLYEAGRSNDCDRDDVRKLLFGGDPQNPALDRPLAVYTISGDNQGLDINTIGSLTETVPIGIRTSVAGEITLRFSGMNEYNCPIYLHDRQTGARINLSQQEEYEYSFMKEDTETWLEDRLYLSFQSPTDISAHGNEHPVSILTTASAIEVLAADGATIQRLQIADLQGRRITDRNLAAQRYTCPIQAGVYIVLVTTEQGTERRKVVVN
jgi:hypothetical protein